MVVVFFWAYLIYERWENIKKIDLIMKTPNLFIKTMNFKL